MSQCLVELGRECRVCDDPFRLLFRIQAVGTPRPIFYEHSALDAAEPSTPIGRCDRLVG